MMLALVIIATVLMLAGLAAPIVAHKMFNNMDVSFGCGFVGCGCIVTGAIIIFRVLNHLGV